MHRKTDNRKLCPFINNPCVTKECAIFNEKFDRCEWGLMAYNLYLLQERLKQQLEPNRK
jgi:hypothetical protein